MQGSDRKTRWRFVQVYVEGSTSGHTHPPALFSPRHDPAGTRHDPAGTRHDSAGTRHDPSGTVPGSAGTMPESSGKFRKVGPFKHIVFLISPTFRNFPELCRHCAGTVPARSETFRNFPGRIVPNAGWIVPSAGWIVPRWGRLKG